MKDDLYFNQVTPEEVENFHQKVSTNIRRLREERGITQHNLALSMGIESVAFYSNCENLRYGKHFNIEHIFKISRILEVDIEKLFIDVK